MSMVRSTTRRISLLSLLLIVMTFVMVSTGGLRTASAKPAANGDPVILGGGNDETVPTSVTNTQSDWAFAGIATAYPNGTGLIGTGSATGVVGNGSGTGVSGVSSAGDQGVGVAGTANGDGGTGVIGQTSGYGGVGVIGNGRGTEGIGVRATGALTGLKATGNLTGVDVFANKFGMHVSAGETGISVYGDNQAIFGDNAGNFATIDAENIGDGLGSSADGVLGRTNSATATGLHGLNTASGSGVFGESQGDGNGVFGQTSSNIASGVYGENMGTGYGLAGRANNGTGVLADSTNGIALLVNGKLQLSRAGLAIIPANKAFIQITGLSGLDPATSFVIATAQGNSKVWVRSVSVDSASALTIYLNAKAAAAVAVAWFILN